VALIHAVHVPVVIPVSLGPFLGAGPSELAREVRRPCPDVRTIGVAIKVEIALVSVFDKHARRVDRNAAENSSWRKEIGGIVRVPKCRRLWVERVAEGSLDAWLVPRPSIVSILDQASDR